MSLIFCLTGSISNAVGEQCGREVSSYQFWLGYGSHSHVYMCVFVCDKFQCSSPVKGLALGFLNVPFSSIAGNSDISLGLLSHNKDLAQAIKSKVVT